MYKSNADKFNYTEKIMKNLNRTWVKILSSFSKEDCEVHKTRKENYNSGTITSLPVIVINITLLKG